MKNLFAVLGLTAAVVLTSCGGGNKKAEDEAARKKREADSLARIEQARQDSLAKANTVQLVSVVETAKADANLSTLVELIAAAGLEAQLSDPNANYTVFAPTNDAFSKVKDLEDLKTNMKRRQELTDLVTYHVVTGRFGSGDLKEGNELDALAGKVIKVTMKDGSLAVGGSKVTTSDVMATNGIIHVIDGVMTPPKQKSKSKNPPATTTTTPTTTTTSTATTTTTSPKGDKFGGDGGKTETGKGDKFGGDGTKTKEGTGKGDKFGGKQ